MSPARPRFVSFYCGDLYYARAAETLKARCAALGVPLLVEAAPDLGAYWRNTLFKPIFLRDRLNALGCDLIWIDADTRLHCDCPEFQALRADLTLASHNGELRGLKASPIGLAYNPRVLAFVNRWAAACEAKLAAGDVDLDHDLLKYEILPAFAGRISLRLMGDPATPRQFTEGAVLTNGLSGRARSALPAVLAKNRRRAEGFARLSLRAFEAGAEAT